MPPFKEDMEVGNVDSPVRTAEDELLNDSDQEDSQAQEAGKCVKGNLRGGWPRHYAYWR